MHDIRKDKDEMKRIKSVQVRHQYTLLQCFYWVSSCAIMGFATVFLQYRGLSNTLVGMSIGGAAFISIWMQPFLAGVVEKVRGLSLKKMILLIILAVTAGYMFLGLVPLPKMAIVGVYLVLNTLYNSITPLITAMGMEYMNQGYEVNFCISRGLGSVSYAVSAVVLGQLVEHFFPGILTFAFAGMEILLFTVVVSMQEPESSVVKEEQEPSSSVIEILKANRPLLLFVAGFGICYMTSSILGTYMINIVRELGGTDGTFGIAAFFCAASEMPAMFLCNYLIRKVSCKKLLKLSSVFFVLRPLVIFLAPNLAVAFLGFALQSLSFGIFTPVSVFFINQELKEKDRVVGQTIFGMVTVGVGSCVGNLAGGFLMDRIGLKTTLGLCVIFAAVGFLITQRVKVEDTGPRRRILQIENSRVEKREYNRERGSNER